MLTIISGTDSGLLHQKTKELLGVKSENGDAVFLDNPSEDDLKEATASQDLFGGSSTFVFRELEDGVYEFLFDNITMLAQSKNRIIVQVEKVLKKQKDICTKEKVEIVEVKSVAKREMPSFVLADAFLKRDKKASFLALNDELPSKPPEEVHGGLWYQIKNMGLIVGGATEEESGLHPFVYKKLKLASKLFSQEEVSEMMKELVEMSHLAHRGQLDFPTALELFVLKYTR